MKRFIQMHKPYIIGSVLVIVFGSTFFVKGKEPEEGKEEPLPIKELIPVILKVDVKGAVNQPGVYEMKEGDRVDDQTCPIMIQRISHLFARKPLILKKI